MLAPVAPEPTLPAAVLLLPACVLAAEPATATEPEAAPLLLPCVDAPEPATLEVPAAAPVFAL